MESDVVRVQEVRQRLECSERKAYEVIKQLNAELKAKGYITIAGRVPRAYFEKRCSLQKKERPEIC